MSMDTDGGLRISKAEFALHATASHAGSLDLSILVTTESVPQEMGHEINCLEGALHLVSHAQVSE